MQCIKLNCEIVDGGRTLQGWKRAKYIRYMIDKFVNQKNTPCLDSYISLNNKTIKFVIFVLIWFKSRHVELIFNNFSGRNQPLSPKNMGTFPDKVPTKTFKRGLKARQWRHHGGIGGTTDPKSRQKLSKKNEIKLVGYTFRLKNYVKISPLLSDFSKQVQPLGHN